MSNHVTWFYSSHICFVIGTFARRQGAVYMDLTFSNRAMQAMAGFAIQFNKNSFGIAPSALQIQTPLAPNSTAQTSLLITPGGKYLSIRLEILDWYHTLLLIDAYTGSIFFRHLVG